MFSCYYYVTEWKLGGLLFLSPLIYVCLSHHSPSSGSLVHYLSLFLSLSLPCPSYRSSGHSGTHDPMCGKRWERSRSTKGLAAINFAQATFTIIQRDSRLIALTLSPRQSLPVPASSSLSEYQGAVSLCLH